MMHRIAPALIAALMPAIGASESGPFQQTHYHLTARPWKPLEIPRARYLDAIEAVCRFSICYQNADAHS